MDVTLMGHMITKSLNMYVKIVDAKLINHAEDRMLKNNDQVQKMQLIETFILRQILAICMLAIFCSTLYLCFFM